METQVLLVLAIINGLVLIGGLVWAHLRGQYVREKQILNDLRLEGYDVKVYPLADPGWGRYDVRIWRNNRWMIVKR